MLLTATIVNLTAQKPGSSLNALVQATVPSLLGYKTSGLKNNPVILVMQPECYF